MPQLTLYGLNPSPPVRACLLTLKALGLPFEYKLVNLLEMEHLKPEFLAKNPTRTVPTLEDNGNYITDSHAIICYLVAKYAQDDALYPKDPLKRAIVDQRLYYETGAVFYNGLRNITKELFFENQKLVPQKKINNIVEVYDTLETFLKDKPYMAGDTMTVADFSLVATVTSLVAFVPIDAAKYPQLSNWIRRLEKLPYYEEANGAGAKQLVDMITTVGFTIVP